MSKIASSLQTDVKVDLQPCGESTTVTLSYVSKSGCRLSMISKLSENITVASLRDVDFWLRLAKAQLRNNVIYAVKAGIDVTVYGLPYTDKGEPTKLANITLSEMLSKTYPDAILRKTTALSIMEVSL
jgi:predicted metal-dependent hydrolase